MSYKHPFGLGNGHISTIYASYFRKIIPVKYKRERLTTPDQDFIDLDWLQTKANKQKKLIILSHGLEGSSKGKYIQGMARYFSSRGFDALAWNYRGCSGEQNLKIECYHSGISSELEFIVEHAIKRYDQIYLIGFSLGRNLTLKYLGEKSRPNQIKAACVFSTPVDLKSTAVQISSGLSKIYGKKFLATLISKMRAKEKLLKKANIDIKNFDKVKNLIDFDHYFTAPIYGFESGDDYYAKSSSLQFLKTIKTPTLIINALNDPFLGKPCYPTFEASQNPYIQLETPKTGGHVAFCSKNADGSYWSEQRAFRFINDL